MNLDTLRRLEGANDDDDPAARWPQTELEKLLGVNAGPLSQRRANSGRRPAPLWPAAFFFVSILGWALVFLAALIVYGLWSGAIWALRLFHP